MQTPLVSIVTAAHKTPENYFRVAAESVLSQEYPDWEWVVSDDSATPVLAALCAEFNDSRIHYSAAEKPLGPYENHRRGFGLAKGEYIVVLNHDDVLKPMFLKKLLDAIQVHAVDLAFCDHDVIDSNGALLVELTEETSARWGRKTLPAGLYVGADLEQIFLQQSISAMNATVFHRRLLDGFERVMAGPAYDLWLTGLFVRNQAKTWYLPERLSAWRTHPTALTSTGDVAWARGAALIWEASFLWFTEIDRLREARRRAGTAWRACAMTYARQNQNREARKAILRAFRYGGDPKTLLAGALLFAPLPTALKRKALR